MQIRYAANSRIGQRPRNEDTFYKPEKGGPKNLVAVADGMGGHRSGDKASSLGMKILCDTFQHTRGSVENRLLKAVQEANRAVYEASLEDPECAGMGTTVIAACPERSNWVLAQVGDSRAYLLEDGKLQQLTTDHSLVAELVKAGYLTPAEARRHPQKNIITRAVGTAADVRTEILKVPMRENQILLLCSDGLSDPIDDEELEALLKADLPLTEIADVLTAQAEANGGRDNITVVLAATGKEAEHLG